MDLDKPELITLLREIERIRQEHELTARLTGENFNVFRILRLCAAEVRTHSAFLAELLDPNGTHGQGATYLKLFLDCLTKDAKIGSVTFTAEGAKVNVEYPIGEVNLEKGTGGRIDLLLTDADSRHIIIENKIYAGDQDSQLLRYRNFDGKAVLLYLTLNGGDPEPISTKGKDCDHRCISYKDHILHWLDDCHKASVSLPVIRETILQYENLIRRLTKQTTGDKVKDEAKKLILAHLDLADAAGALWNAWQEIFYSVKNDFLAQAKLRVEKIIPVEGDLSILRYCNDENDGDGVWIGFRAFRGELELEVPADEVAAEFAGDLQTLDQTARKSGTYYNICVFNPKPFGRTDGFENLPKSEIAALYDKAALARFVESVGEQADEVTNKLLARIRERK